MSFLHDKYGTNLTINYGVLGTQTRGSRMVSGDKSSVVGIAAPLEVKEFVP